MGRTTFAGHFADAAGAVLHPGKSRGHSLDKTGNASEQEHGGDGDLHR